MKVKVNGKIIIFCGKCHEEIPCGEEVIIKGKVVVCKKCFHQGSSAVCHICYLPIFKHELIYEVSESWNIDIESRSVNSVQCYLCHRDWLKETKGLKRFWKWKMLIVENHIFWTTFSLTLHLTFLATILGIGGLEDLEVLMSKIWKSFILTLLVASATRILISLLFEFTLTRILKKNKEERWAKRNYGNSFE